MTEFIKFLDCHSGALTFLATAVYVVATIFICRANIHSANASKAQLEEMRRQYNQENRPNIEVEFLYSRRTFYGLRFINHGKCTAHNVRILLDSTFIDSLPNSKFSDLLRVQAGKSCIIGVGQHYDLYFGSNEYLVSPNKSPAKGKILYQAGGNEYESEFYIDLDSYATIFSVNSEQDDLIRKLKEQNAELKGIKNAIQNLKSGYSFTSTCETRTLVGEGLAPPVDNICVLEPRENQDPPLHPQWRHLLHIFRLKKRDNHNLK